jgi:hypothetical protein
MKHSSRALSPPGDYEPNHETSVAGTRETFAPSPLNFKTPVENQQLRRAAIHFLSQFY